MKKILFLFVACVFAIAANAVPARPVWSTVVQSDGTTIELRTIGDEYYHYTINRDGQQVREVNGMYEVVGEAPTPEVAKARHAAAKAKRTRKATSAEFGYSPYLPPKGVVIMVNYKDKKFQTSTTKAVIDELCNSDNCTVNKYNGVNYGSIGQYFRDQSDGQYNLQLDVYGPVTLDNNYSYYGQDYQQEGNDKYSGNVIIEACKKMDSEIDFSQYDWNNDGDVDFVYVVYAGKGQADGGDDNTIWPHSFDIESSRFYGNCTYTESQCKFDGKRVQSYAMSNELSGSSLAGIGIICHEYGHVIGLPDHYDTDYSTNYEDRLTPNEWDVMDGGSYNGGIHCPPNYNAWEKAFCGWYTPENLGNEGRNVEMKPIGTEGYSAYQINSSGKQQTVTTNGLNYYIECRQQKGWDTYLPAAGMLIWQVNYNKTMWGNNAPNLTSNGNPHFTLVIPSGTEIGSDYGSKNVWPYSNKTSWSEVSGKPLKDITKSGSNITLIYIEEPADPFDITWMANGAEFTTTTSTGTVVLPTNTPQACSGKEFVGWCSQANYTSATTAPTFVNAGDAVQEGATFYAVFATKDGEGSAPTKVASVTFQTASNNGSWEITDFSKIVDEESGIASYSGSKVYKGTAGAKLGTSNDPGSLTLTLSSTVEVSKVTVSGSAYDNSVKLKVTAGTTVLGEKSPATNVTYEAASPVSTNKITVETVNANRAYVSAISVTANAGPSYKDYTTKCESGSDIEQIEEQKTNCRKFIKDGQLFILRGDAVYNVTGARIQ